VYEVRIARAMPPRGRAEFHRPPRTCIQRAIDSAAPIGSLILRGLGGGDRRSPRRTEVIL